MPNTSIRRWQVAYDPRGREVAGRARVGRRRARLEAKADEILKVHRDAARVAKARELSPAFDAECRAEEQPVGFWQWAGYIHGRLRHDGGYAKVLLLAGMILFLVWIAPFIWLMVKALAILVPIWFFTALAGPQRQYRRRVYRDW